MISQAEGTRQIQCHHTKYGFCIDNLLPRTKVKICVKFVNRVHKLSYLLYIPKLNIYLPHKIIPFQK